MKKLIYCLSFMLMVTILFSDLDVDIPFDQNIVGASYTETGEYEYESDWIIVTNTGTETQTYTLLYSWENLPAGWTMSVCNEFTCFIPNFPSPIELVPGETEQIHIQIHVTSTAGYNFYFTFDGGDITEPMTYDFSFNTADNVGIEQEDYITNTYNTLNQNYPNPFNTSTTIPFSLSAKDTKEAKLDIYNVKGQLVHQYSVSNQQSSILWDGKDMNGRDVPNGVYLYKLSTSNTQRSRKMILLR